MKPAKPNNFDRRRLISIAGNVALASRYVPRATCLTQALATLILLDLYRYPVTLRIGVARNNVGEFEAHAWIESDGSVVIGGSKTDLYKRYSLLPRF